MFFLKKKDILSVIPMPIKKKRKTLMGYFVKCH